MYGSSLLKGRGRSTRAITVSPRKGIETTRSSVGRSGKSRRRSPADGAILRIAKIGRLGDAGRRRRSTRPYLGHAASGSLSRKRQQELPRPCGGCSRWDPTESRRGLTPLGYKSVPSHERTRPTARCSMVTSPRDRDQQNRPSGKADRPGARCRPLGRVTQVDRFLHSYGNGAS